MYDDFDEMMTEATTEMGAVDATKLRHEAEAAAAAEKEKEAAAKKAAKEEAMREKKREAALKSEQEKVAKALKAAALVQEKKKKELAAKKAAESAAANGGDAAPPKSPAHKPAPINFAAMASKSPASPPQVKQQQQLSQPPPQQQHHHHHPSVGDGGIGGIGGGPGLPQPAPVTAPGGSWNEPLQLPPSSPGKQVGDVSQLNQQLPEPSMQGAGQVPAGLQVRSRSSDRTALALSWAPVSPSRRVVSGLTRRSPRCACGRVVSLACFVYPLAGNERGCNAEPEPAAFVSIVDEPARAARAAHRL